jgi:hypothetical protein
LPVLVVERARQRRVDLGAAKGRECQDCAAADSSAVGARDEHRWQPAGITQRAERGDRGFAGDRVTMSLHDTRERVHRARIDRAFTEFAKRPRRGFHHGDVAILERSNERVGDVDVGCAPWRELRAAPPDGGSGIRNCEEDGTAGGIAAGGADEGTRCGSSHPWVGVAGERLLGALDICRGQWTLMTQFGQIGSPC